ncbi:hypothetical protein Tco_0260207 [Tanacetum coccineum]
MPPEDNVLPAEEQPLPTAVLPIADSPGYVPESDHEEDPEEDDDEDPADYPTDRDDDDEEEKEPSRDEADDEEEDDEEEEEDPALADSIPPPVHHVIARISIQAQTPIPLPSNTEVARLLAIPTPLPSPLSPWSSPLPQIPSPPLPVSSPLPAPSTSHSLLLPSPIILSRTRSDVPPSGTPPILPIPLPTSSPSLLLPSIDHGVNMPEVCFPPRKRLCFAFGPRKIRRDPKREVGYEIIDTWDEMLEDMPRAPTTDETELGRRMTNFVTTVRQDAYGIYMRLGGSTVVRDCSLASSRPRSAGTSCGDTETDEYTADTGVVPMLTLLTTKGVLGQVKSLLAMNVEPRDNLDRDCSKLEKQPMWVTKVGNGKAPAKKLCTAFSSQIDITPTTLDHYYDVELADVRIIRLNAIIRGERHLMIGPLQQGKNCRPTGKENYSTRLHKASIHSHLGELPVLFVKKKDDPFQCSSPAPSTEERLSEAAFRTRYGHYEFQIRQAMTKLTQKKVKFVWGDKQKTVFQLLKQKLCSALILALPEGSEDFIAYCDASIKGFVKSKEWL